MRIATIPDSIDVLLNYNNKNLSLIVKRFKKLGVIKEKAYQLFYPIKYDIKIKYNNKDLSSFLDQSIGLIFENRTKVKLDIVPIIGTKRQIKNYKLMTKKNLSNISALCIFPSKPAQVPILSSDINDRYKSINTEKVNNTNKINNSCNENNKNTNNDNNKSISPGATSRNKLPPIKYRNKSKNEMSYKDKDININITERKKNENKSCNDISSYTICRECLTNETKYYCRKCNTFTCVKCNNKKHKKHILLDIDITNEKINLEKYKETLNNKLYDSKHNLDNLDNVLEGEMKEEDWRKKYNEAVDNLARVAEDAKDEIIKNKSNKEENNNMSNNIHIYQNKLKIELENLNNINITTNKDPFELFNEINRKERILNQIVKEGSNKTNIIEEMFVDIENEIDFVLFELEEQLNSN